MGGLIENAAIAHVRQSELVTEAQTRRGRIIPIERTLAVNTQERFKWPICHALCYNENAELPRMQVRVRRRERVRDAIESDARPPILLAGAIHWSSTRTSRC